MFAIHYVVSRESDQPVYKPSTQSASLDKAIAIARQRIRSSNITTGPHPIGFLIYDASGGQLFHREYPATK